MSTGVSLFSKRLSLLREEKGWSLETLAGKLEISRVTCGYYEKGLRRPDTENLIKICKTFDVSSDYILGLSDTKKPQYSNINKTTGLNEKSINMLNSMYFCNRDILNLLICEEYEPESYCEPPDLEDEKYTEFLYQQYLEDLPFEIEVEKKPILEHLAEDWKLNEKCIVDDEYFEYINSPEYLDKQEEEILSQTTDYSNIDPDIFGPHDETYEEYLLNQEYQEKMRAEYEERERKKSYLLSKIADYISYTNGCTLDTNLKHEKLTNEHQIKIGTGRGNTITFPSKEADELLEFAMLQRVIDALKKFKNNYYESAHNN